MALSMTPVNYRPSQAELEEIARKKKEQTQLQNADYLRDQARQGIEGLAGREAPDIARTQISPVQTGQAAQLGGAGADWRQMQLQTAQRLAGIASGAEKGAGQLAVDDQVRRGVAAQQAMARMGRGAQAGLAAREAARGAAELGIAGAAQARQAGVAEQQAALGQLAGVTQAGRAQDIGVAESQAQLQQQMNLANLGAQNQAVFQQAQLDQARNLAEVDSRLRMMGMNDQARLAYMGQLFGVDQAELQARLQKEQQDRQFWGNSLSLAGQGVAGLATMISDRAAKRAVKAGGDEIDEMLDRARAYSWAYKDQAHGQGRHAGVMAQDLEQSTLGREMIRKRPDGLREIDGQKALTAALAAVSRLNERLRKVEGKES